MKLFCRKLSMICDFFLQKSFQLEALMKWKEKVLRKTENNTKSHFFSLMLIIKHKQYIFSSSPFIYFFVSITYNKMLNASNSYIPKYILFFFFINAIRHDMIIFSPHLKIFFWQVENYHYLNIILIDHNENNNNIQVTM
jgi:hypothetical protein